MKIIQGKETFLNLSACDELNQTIPAFYQAMVSSEEDIRLDRRYSLLSNTTVKLHGRTGATGELRLQAFGLLGNDLKSKLKWTCARPDL